MTTENWFEALTAELLAQSPFRRSEYFTRFASAALSREQVCAHISHHYLRLAFFRRLADEIPWSASLCATALLEEEVVEIAQTVGRALVQHYGVRPEWGGMNYTVHEAIEKEESGETKKTILKHLRTPDDRRAA